MSRIVAGTAGLPEQVDLLVVGLGATGAGVALDAASRGLRVAAVDAFDVAWGTSRFSSKLVHGGLRYLGHGQFGVAHESAVERGILMEHTAPHLVHAMPMVIPLTPTTTHLQALIARSALVTGEMLRRSALTSRSTLPKPRRMSPTETLALAPAVKRAGLRGGMLSWDGQLEDDVRLVLGIARTAAAHGAAVHTRTRVLRATGTRAWLRDELTGQTCEVGARAVVNATGVWADRLAPDIRLKPSRGTHLVVRRESLPHVRCALTAHVPGSYSRFVFALPQPDDLFFIGVTDDEVSGEVPDVPEVPEQDAEFLLGVLNHALERPLTAEDVVGSYAGLRPLLDSGGSTSDLSRRHAVLDSQSGVVTVVGGKLTTYRRMAEDTVDHVARTRRLACGPCRTRRLPLLGAASPEELETLAAPPRLVRRFGTEASTVLDDAVATTGLTESELLASTQGVTLAELVFGVTHEGAADVDDLLDRRTRVGLVPTDREAVRPLAERALEVAQKVSAPPV